MKNIKTSKICEFKGGNNIIKLTVTRDFFNEDPNAIHCYITLTLRYEGETVFRIIGNNKELYDALISLIEGSLFSVNVVRKVFFRLCKKNSNSRYMEVFGFDKTPFEAYFNSSSKKSDSKTKRVHQVDRLFL